MKNFHFMVYIYTEIVDKLVKQANTCNLLHTEDKGKLLFTKIAKKYRKVLKSVK